MLCKIEPIQNNLGWFFMFKKISFLVVVFLLGISLNFTFTAKAEDDGAIDDPTQRSKHVDNITNLDEHLKK